MAPSGIELPVVDVNASQPSVDADIDLDSEPMPTVDPTAELLGTAKRKRPTRARPTSPTAGAAVKKAAAPTRARKSPARRAPRGRKTPDVG
jgi:hypothetical protein